MKLKKHLKDDQEKSEAPELNFKCHSTGSEYLCQCDIYVFGSLLWGIGCRFMKETNYVNNFCISRQHNKMQIPPNEDILEANDQRLKLTLKRGWVFRHNNVPMHLRKMKVLQLPPLSPDLNILINLWREAEEHF